MFDYVVKRDGRRVGPGIMEGALARFSARVGSDLVVAFVSRHRVQESGQRFPRWLDAFRQFDEARLCGILGVFAISQNPQTRGVDHPGMARDEFAERLGVAIGGPLLQ